MKFVAFLALSIVGASTIQAAERPAGSDVPPSGISTRADNLVACVGYYHAMVEATGQADVPSATLDRATEATSAFARRARWDGYLSAIQEARQVFVGRLRSDPAGFLQATRSIADDCEQTFSRGTDNGSDFGAAPSKEKDRRTPYDFTVRDTVMRVNNVSLGDGPSACDGAEPAQIGAGSLKGCSRGTEKDRLSLTFDRTGEYVIKIERTMLLDYRRLDWRKFVSSARAYGEPDAYNLNHWLVGYGNNFSVTGSDNAPIVEWKDSGRGLLMKGNPCDEDGCRGVDGTNVEVVVTLMDSDEIRAARDGKAPKPEKTAAAAGYNLAARSVADAIAAARARAEAVEKAREAAAAAERRAQEEKERQLAQAPWRASVYAPDDGSLTFRIHGKTAKIRDIALGDGPDTCPTKLEQFIYDGQYLAILCRFGEGSDRMTVYYDIDRKQVVRVFRRLGVVHQQTDLDAVLAKAAENYGPGGYRSEKRWLLAYGTSFAPDDNGVAEGKTGRGLVVEAEWCRKTTCDQSDGRTAEITFDLKDVAAYEKSKTDGEVALKKSAEERASEIRF